MNLPDLKQLEKVITLCRKKGVKSIKIDNVELTLADEVPVSNYKAKQTKSIDSVQSNIESDGWDSLTEEERLFYSVSSPESILGEGN